LHTGFVDILEDINDLSKIKNILGQEILPKRNTLMLYIYENGEIEKRIVIE
jgi:hypothetical protein